ncbi:MAG: PAS domain S-box protein [candidate division Zixibacteria bacterium]|nr:PAS domain S-box protein [candidate division Zixibacteria bacterium]
MKNTINKQKISLPNNRLEDIDLNGLTQSTEEKLKEAYTIINQSSSIAFTWKNIEGWPVEFVTQNVEKLFGYTAEEFLSGDVSYNKCVHPDDLQQVADEVAKFSANKTNTEFIHQPYRIITKDGTPRIVSDWTFIQRDKQGNITHYKGIVEDITERVKAEEALKQNEKRYSQIVSSIPGVVYQFVISKKGEFSFSYMSQMIEDLLSIKPEILIDDANKMFDYIHPDDQKKFASSIEQSSQSLSQWELEFRIVTPQNNTIWIKGSSNPNLLENGDIVWNGVLMDISKNKQAEEELRQYEQIVSSSDDMLALLNNDFRYLAANEKYVTAFDKTQSEIVGLTVAEVFGVEFFETVIKPNAEKCLQGEHINYQDWFDFPTSGKKFMEISYYPYRDQNDNIKGFMVNGRDITKRKLAEDKLVDKNRLTQIILDSLPFPAMLIKKDRVVVAANKVARDAGAEEEGFCWKSFGHTEYIPKEDREFIELNNCVPEAGTKCTFCLADETFSEDELQNDSEVYAFDRIWDTFWIPVDDEVYLHFAIDITERKNAETAIKAEKDIAQNYLNIAGVMFTVVNADETISLINKKGYEILGHKENELIGKNWFDMVVPEKSREKIRGVFARLIMGDIKPVEFYENILLTKNGNERLIAFHNTVIRDIDGKITGVLFSAEDITDRKKMEQKLQRRTSDLKERVKELGCLYSISKLIQNPEYSYYDILQGVIDIIPPSLQYPEITCARLTIENEEIKTDNFKETEWKMSSKILESEKEIGLLEVCYLEKCPRKNEGPFIKEERALIDAITERLGRYIERKRAKEALYHTNEKLIVEQETLREKNITLKEVLSQIEKEKQQIAVHTQSNIDRIVIPILNKLEEKMQFGDKTYATLLRNSLNDITHPFINNMESRFSKLTPREIEICNMIKNGLSSKEISSTLNTSVGTVFNQRKTIRKKLGIANDNVNLSSFLHSS